jgi:hypothetical protein
MHPDFLVRPVILRAHGQVVDIFELPEDGLGSTLPSIGQNDLLGRPVVLIGDQETLTEHFGFELGQGGMVDPPGQALRPGPLLVVRDL